MKNLATFIIKHFPKLAEEIYYIIDHERYHTEPAGWENACSAEDLPF